MDERFHFPPGRDYIRQRSRLTPTWDRKLKGPADAFHSGDTEFAFAVRSDPSVRRWRAASRDPNGESPSYRIPP